MVPDEVKSKFFDISENIIGSGACSIVKTAFLKSDKNTLLSLKICYCNGENDWLQSLKEISILKKLINPNIVKMMNYEITKSHVLIGLHKGDGSLKELISSPMDLRPHAISLMSQIINALNFIHSSRIIHDDIKPGNIIYNVVDREISIKLIDFGISHVVGMIDTPGGTKVYQSPERLFGLQYEESSDLFSAGIVFFEILFKEHPFYKEGQCYLEFMKKKPTPRFPEGYQSKVDKEWLQILCSLLSYNTKNREEVRNNNLLDTKYSECSVNHKNQVVQNIAKAEQAEKEEKYAESAVLYIDASLNLAISTRQGDTDSKESILEINNTIMSYKRKALNSIKLLKQSFAHFDIPENSTVYDKYYQYLQEVTASTPALKHHIDIGYEGQLYLCENKKDLAYKNFMSALDYLNRTIRSEPAGDRKNIIGKKVRYSLWPSGQKLVKH